MKREGAQKSVARRDYFPFAIKKPAYPERGYRFMFIILWITIV